MWQGIIVTLIVAAAGLYLFHRFKSSLTSSDDAGGCGGGCGCGGGGKGQSCGSLTQIESGCQGCNGCDQ
jgi:hypothetical protein